MHYLLTIIENYLFFINNFNNYSAVFYLYFLYICCCCKNNIVVKMRHWTEWRRHSRKYYFDHTDCNGKNWWCLMEGGRRQVRMSHSFAKLAFE